MSARLAGHELQYEGAAYDKQGRPLDVWRMRAAGAGRGKCSCGALSPELPSGAQRKAWHRAHKDEIRSAGPLHLPAVSLRPDTGQAHGPRMRETRGTEGEYVRMTRPSATRARGRAESRNHCCSVSRSADD